MQHDSASVTLQTTGSPFRLAAALFVLLGALYFLTYTGHPVSGDEEVLFDGVHSLAVTGNLWLAYMNDTRQMGLFPKQDPVSSVDSEPMQMIAALPLFKLAAALPAIGLMQTVWLLNVIVTALTAVLLFAFGRLLGYREATAWVVALLFGLATMAWPYSKVFFREPLLALFVLASAYCIQRWRRAWVASHFRIGWAVGAFVSFGAALATKNPAALFLPALLLTALPEHWRHVHMTRRQALIGLLVAPVVMVALLLIALAAAHGRYDPMNLINRLLTEAKDVPYALAGYLLSPGRSVWAFNPILLLGIWGARRLIRQRHWREVFIPLLALISLALGYALLQTSDWYGGTAWGPRYLEPVIPFLALLLLPVVDALPRAGRIAQAVAGLLLLISIGVQLLGTLIPLTVYYDFLGAETVRLGLPGGAINGWQAGTWDIRYIPFTVLPRFFLNGGTDLAWQINGTPGIALLAVLLIGAALIVRRRPVRRSGWLLIAGFVALLGIGLVSYRTDPRYGGANPALQNALATLERQAKSGDVVLLNDRAYRPFFMNFFKPSVPIFALRDAPGEPSAPGQPAEVVSTNVEALASPSLQMMLPRIALLGQRWWFVTEFIPADQRRTRATERYLTVHYFPVGELLSSDQIRVVQFDATSAPRDTLPPWPQAPRSDTFGPLFTLVGTDPAPAGLRLIRGQPLPVSLLWRFAGWPAGMPPFDYSLNLSLIDSHGAIVPGAQQSGTPLGSFGATSGWQPGGYYRDNHAVPIPADLPPGTYTLWAIWYDWRDGSRLRLTDGSDHAVLYTITVP